MPVFNPLVVTTTSHRLLDDIRKGTDNFAGYGSYTTITLSPAMPDTNYRVTIKPTADPGYVGGIWISDKATNSFRVNNSGSGISAFEWAAEAF
jgi:hypothetical protein